MAIHDSRSRILKDIGKYSIANYVAAIFTFAGQIVYRRALAPEEFGIWAGLLILIGYTTSAHFGVIHGMEREVPFFLGKGETNRVKTIQDTAFTAILIISLVIGIALFVSSFFIRNKYTTDVICGIRSVSVIIVLMQLYNIYFTLAKCYKNFSVLSWIRAGLPIVTIIGSVSLILPFGIYGMYAGNIIALVIVIYFLIRKTDFRLALRVDIAELKRVFKIGIILFACSYLGTVFMTIDGVLVAKYLGAASMGYYSIAVMAQSAMTNIPRAIAANMYPRILQVYGNSEDLKDIHGYVVQPAMTISLFMPVIIGAAYFLIHPVINILLPKYIPGISATRIILFGTFFIFLRYTFEHLLIASGKTVQLAILQVPPAILGFVLGYGMIRADLGINGVAVSISVAFLAYSTMLIAYACKDLIDGRWGILRLIFLLYCPIFYTAFSVYLIHTLGALLPPWTRGEFLLPMVQLCLLAVLSVPLYYCINRQTKMVTKLVKVIVGLFHSWRTSGAV